MTDAQYEKLVLQIAQITTLQAKHEALTSTFFDLMKPIIAKERGITGVELQKLITERILINQEAAAVAILKLMSSASPTFNEFLHNQQESPEGESEPEK